MDDRAGMIFPWQTAQWQQFSHAKQTRRLAHAYLLTGIYGLGKLKFAIEAAHLLLCPNEGCQDALCHTRRFITANKTHSNLCWIEPEEAGHAIKVDQIRALNEFVQQTSLQGEYRLVVIQSANQMNINAANALLKTLEEPAPGAILILVCDEVSHLPATILSRCQRITFSQPKREPALAWLKNQLKDQSIDANLLLNLAHGAPLAALEWQQTNRVLARQELFELLYALKQRLADPLTAAVKIQAMDSRQFLDDMLSWIIDLLHLQVGGKPESIINQNFLSQLRQVINEIPMMESIHLMSYLQQVRSQIMSGINLNKQLLIENILIRWSRAHVSR